MGFKQKKSTKKFLAKNPDGKGAKKPKMRRDRDKKKGGGGGPVGGKEEALDEVEESVRTLESMDVDEFMKSDLMMGGGDSDGDDEEDEAGEAVAEEDEEDEEGEGEGEDSDEGESDEEVSGLKKSVST